MPDVEKAKQIINQERQAKLADIIDRVNTIMAQKQAYIEECDKKINEILGDEYVITNVIAYKEI
jgi:ribosome assembly protein YihI (activator of Der GTPase)